jgi:fibronectin type 3 domain-containing protein
MLALLFTVSCTVDAQVGCPTEPLRVSPEADVSSGNVAPQIICEERILPPIPAAPAVSYNGTSLRAEWSFHRRANYHLLRQIVNGVAQAPVNLGMSFFQFSASAGKNYRFQLAACNDAGCTPYSAVSATAYILAPPGGLSATYSGLTVSNSWYAVSAATSYNIRQSTNNNWGNAINKGTARTHAITGVPGGSYRYQVQACTNLGCSAWSAATPTITLPPIPAVPAGLNASLSGTSVSVGWNVATHATSYLIRQSINGNWGNAVNKGTARTHGVIAIPGNSYQYQVASCNSSGCSGWSAATSALAVAPSVPAGLAASLAGTDINVSWQAAAHATSYEIRQNTNGSWGNAVVKGGVLIHKAAVTPGSSYQYQVLACSNNICSVWSSATSVIVAPPPVPASLEANMAGSALSVSWNSSASAISYHIRQSTNGSWGSPLNKGAVLAHSITASEGATYQFIVQACSATICSAWSAATEAIRKPVSLVGITYLHTDVLGSVIAESDENGQIINKTDYKPFGQSKDN